MKKNLKNGDPKRQKILKLHLWTWHVDDGDTQFVLRQFLHHIFNKRELKQLDKFMVGQTGPLINGLMAYYPSDIQRFILNQPNTD